MVVYFSYLSCKSDPEFASAPTTPISVYTDAEAEESLLKALEEGDFELAFQLLPHIHPSDPGEIVRVGCHQLTLLHYACQHGRLDIIKDLVENHAYSLSDLEVNLPTPLQIAAASGQLSVVEYIVGRLPNLSFKPKKSNPFHVAAEHGWVEVMKFWLNFDANLLTMVDNDGNTPLHLACYQGHLPAVAFLANDNKHPLNMRNRRGETALHLATKYCQLDVAKFLVEEKRCSIAVKDLITGSTPLHIAAKVGCFDLVQYFSSEKMCDMECKNSPQKSPKAKQATSGRTPLHYASYGGHCEIVAYLVEEKACNPCCTDDVGFTPLHLSCQEGHAEVVRYLLNLNEVEPNQAVTDDGVTPIHSASLSGNLEVVKLIIDQNDGDASCIDSEGRTPLHYCSRKGHTDIARYLLGRDGSNPNCVDQSHVTPLHLAAQYGHLDTVTYLVSEASANTNLMEENGYVPLHLAANKGRSSVVEFLIENRHSNVAVRDKTGRTPLHHACQSGHLEVVQFLTSQAESDCSIQEKSLKATPLHLAASFGHYDIVQHLVDEKGCSPTCTDKFNSTPIHRAAASGHVDIMNFFVKEKQCSSVVKNKFGNTPLHLACQKEKINLVELLLSYSKDSMMARNQVGRMPLDLTDNVDILNVFIKHGIDPSKGSISSKFPYLKYWEPLGLTNKIFLLGDLATGKSTLAKTLRGGGFFQEWVTGRFQRVTPPDAETSGIVPINFESRHFGRVILYDFAGHPTYHSSHSAIISIATHHSSPILLLTVDLRNSPGAIEKSINYWSALVHSTLGAHESSFHAFLLGTHEDELSKDELRHKTALLDKVVGHSLESKLNFSGWLTLDARKPNSASIHKLRQFISHRCDSLQSGTHLDHNSCLLRSFILYKFQETIVIEIEELLDYLSHTNIPNIKNRENLHQACWSLHSRGYLLFLEGYSHDQSSWIIHNQEAILSMVHGFHKMVEIPNPLGLVSISQLQTSLGTIGFNVSLAIRYFVRMEFCIKLADRRSLYSVSGFALPHPLEDHLFFPHLVRSSAPPDLWNGSNPSTPEKKLFGWHMVCAQEQQMLGPRFLQQLLLRLAFHFPFNTNPNYPFAGRKSSCIIWRKGLFWTDSKGIDSFIEVQKSYRAVTFLTRTRKELKSALDFHHFRSAVIHKIRNLIKEKYSHISVVESVIHPDNLNGDILGNYESFSLHFKLSCIQEAVLSGTNTVSNEELVHKDEVVEMSVNSTFDVKDILSFEPFMGFPKHLLEKMFSCDDQHGLVSDEAYIEVCRALSALHWNLNDLSMVLRLQYSSAKVASVPSGNHLEEEMRTLFHRWDSRGQGKSRKSYKDLKCVFGAYSILKIRN